MKKSLLISLFSLVLLISSQLYAQINIVSPVKGVWSNKQMLVLDNASDGDYFYSVDGSDPASFGFAYDGPVLLDVEGDVTLKITKIISKNTKENAEVKFTVKCDDAVTKPYAAFISSFYDSGVLNYTSGSQLQIPDSLYYSFGLPPDSFIKGQTVSLSEKSVLSRIIPCTLWDKNSDLKYRFMIHTFPISAGTFSRRDLPVKITDWETVEFLDNNLIYKIDSEYWSLPKEPVHLNRSVSHMISWQNLAYEFGNPVEFIILPPKPEVKTENTEDGELKIVIEGDSGYKLSVLDEDNSYEELFSELGIDVFYGDKVTGVLKTGVFCNGLLQGTIEIPYKLNKRPPASPLITSSAEGFYSREDVQLTITGSDEGKLYYAVSKPLPVDSSRHNPECQEFKELENGNFIQAEGNQVNLTFTGLKDSGVYYKVSAYSSDGTITSNITEYSVIVDQYNYYFDSNSAVQNPDGSAEQPFNDFNELLKYINLSRSVNLCVSGDMVIPAGKNILGSNCVITGSENSTITFEPDAQLVVIDSTLDVRNITVRNQKAADATSIVPLFKGERSNLIFTDCLLYGDFERNGTLVDAANSNVYIDKSICAVACSSYASFVSAVNSKVNIKNSNLNASADTSVIISMSKGQITCSGNSFKISGKTGRIAELFGVGGQIQNNVFKAELTKVSKSVVPVYTEKDCTVIINNNENYGF